MLLYWALLEHWQTWSVDHRWINQWRLNAKTQAAFTHTGDQILSSWITLTSTFLLRRHDYLMWMVITCFVSALFQWHSTISHKCTIFSPLVALKIKLTRDVFLMRGRRQHWSHPNTQCNACVVWLPSSGWVKICRACRFLKIFNI